MENNRNFLPDNFIRSRSLPVFVLASRLWLRHSPPKGKLTRMTRWLSKHQRLRFMRHNNLPIEILASVADTTRTMTVISEQVIKDQGATNLTDALKTSPAWVRFCG